MHARKWNVCYLMRASDGMVWWQSSGEAHFIKYANVVKIVSIEMNINRKDFMDMALKVSSCLLLLSFRRLLLSKWTIAVKAKKCSILVLYGIVYASLEIESFRQLLVSIPINFGYWNSDVMTFQMNYILSNIPKYTCQMGIQYWFNTFYTFDVKPLKHPEIADQPFKFSILN